MFVLFAENKSVQIIAEQHLFIISTLFNKINIEKHL